jgi:hypothetical protein
MPTRSRLESLVATLHKSKRQGVKSLPAAKRRSLVREFGTDAIRALLQVEHPKWQAEVFELDEPSSPWPYGDITALQVAKRALGPLAKRLPKLVARLGTAERVVVAHHEGEADAPDRGGWFLVYALPSEHGPQLWLAGPPTPAPDFRVEGWTLPEPLQQLYARHDGLGLLCDEFGWTGFDPGVQPAVRLSRPALDQHEGADEAPRELLRFTRGVGSSGEAGWCFLRTHEGDDAPQIVELDDEWGSTSKPERGGFWAFLDRWLTTAE